jgi:hypothetical protein
MTRQILLAAGTAAVVVIVTRVAQTPRHDATEPGGAPQAPAAGTLRLRPGAGRAPEFPPPSIVDYYRDDYAFPKLYGMGPPDETLKKLYYENALALVPGLPRDAFSN